MSHYYAYVAGRGFNITGLGVAFYDDEGLLAGKRFAGVERAISRGDLPDTPRVRSIDPNVPKAEADMEHQLTTMANAMSMARWDGPFGTIVSDDISIDRTFAYVIGKEPQ